MKISTNIQSWQLIICAMALGSGSACGAGGDDAGPSISVDSFVGQWSYASGSVDTTCTGGPEVSIDMTGEVTTIAQGTETDLIMPDEACPVGLDVTGTIARLSAPVVCAFSDEDLTVELTLETYSIATTDGERATESGTGTSLVTIDGDELTCSSTISGTLDKL